ncbi:MAG: hypothetical protein AAFP84_20635, partial [Actinomycetota bacterium]
AEDALGSNPFAGVYDGYVRHYSRAGVVGWTWTAGTDRSDRVVSVTADPAGVVALGHTTGEFGGQTALGGTDAFVTILDADAGAELDLAQFGTPGVDEPAAVATDFGNRYVVGTTRGSFPAMANAGGRDGFVGQLVPDPTVAAGDTFTRATSASWGRATVGGGWQVAPRSQFSVAGGAGRVALVGGAPESVANLRAVGADDATMTFSVTLDELPTGGSLYLYAVLGKNGPEEHRMRIRVRPDGAATMRAIRRGVGVWRPLDANVAVPLVVEPGRTFRMAFETESLGATTRLRGAAWPAGEARPEWQVDVVDDLAVERSTGAVGLRFRSPVSSANVELAVDDLTVVER